MEKSHSLLRKVLADDIKKFANRIKELEKIRKVNKGARVFFGFILILLVLTPLGKAEIFLALSSFVLVFSLSFLL